LKHGGEEETEEIARKLKALEEATGFKE